MPDDFDLRGQKGGSHILMDDDFEVRLWSRHLKVSRDEFLRMVGNAAAAVR